MVSSSDEFHVMLQEHPFNILALSETWLKDDVNLLNFVQIIDHKFSYKNQLKEEEGVLIDISTIQLNTKYAMILTR